MSSEGQMPRYVNALAYAKAKKESADLVPYDETAYEAHRLRIRGLEWRDIAKRTGYASEASCRGAVDVYLQRAALEWSADRRSQALTESLAAYDHFITTWWDRAEQDHRAAA